MVVRKTVIVVGAGASKEFGLPVGSELKNSIANILDYRFEHGFRRVSGDDLVYEALKRTMLSETPTTNDINPYLEAGRRIIDAMPQAISIDNYIDAHQGDKKLELCGKLAIVRSIIEAESNSKLFIDVMNNEKTVNFKSVEGTWINSFMQLLTENCRVGDLKQRLSNIEFIIFNYDRCIEHYLYHALQNYYKIKPEDAADLVRGIKIFHPYGTVGNLPWYANENSIEFGYEPNYLRLIELASKIKTFTEGTDPESSDVLEIRNGVANADIMLFLGFAYHRQNMKLIFSGMNPTNKSELTKYFGTAIGLSSHDCEIISSELQPLTRGFKEVIHLRNDLACSNLFREYWRSLSLS